MSTPGPDRVEAMIAYLREHADEINRWDFGQIRLDWSPFDIKTFIGHGGKIGPPHEEKLSA